jgi:predicted pyridoxine 5'-phosphate oxidase superfamily flavin-nucleotide-binding protein
MQRRGGPPGFVRVLDATTLGFADLSGNRQHVSLGNLANNDRVALFFMDYANRRRLKLLGHAQVVRDDPALLARLTPAGAERLAESAILIRVAGFEWNCPQHITQRFTPEEWRMMQAG